MSGKNNYPLTADSYVTQRYLLFYNTYVPKNADQAKTTK